MSLLSRRNFLLGSTAAVVLASKSAAKVPPTIGAPGHDASIVPSLKLPTVKPQIALTAPLAPTVALTNGNNQIKLVITDNVASQQVQKYGIYSSPTSGGTLTFRKWAYNPADVREYLANASTSYYKVTSWNAAGESGYSGETTGTASSSNTNPLRLAGVVLFVNQLFYEMLCGDWQTGSTVSVTSSDGATLSTKTDGGAILVYGTFASVGAKTLTFTENLSGGGTSVSTQIVQCVALPALGSVTATATAIKARITSPPTYTPSAAILVTDTGASMPGGYTATHTWFAGRSIYPPFIYTAVGSFQPATNAGKAWEPLTASVVSEYVNQYGGCNAVLRQRIFKQTFVVGFGSDGGTAVGRFKVRYSDDGMATWAEMADPVYIKAQTGAHYMKIDTGSVPSGAGRIVEVEYDNYTYFTDSASVLGFGYEAGDTPQAVADSSPICAIYVDSYANGVGAMDHTINMGRTAARGIGLLNFWNLGVPSHRYTHPATSTFPLGLNRIGDNVLGIGDIVMPYAVDVFFMNATINDNSVSDQTQAQAIISNFLLRLRRNKPNLLIVFTIGISDPNDHVPTALYNSYLAAFAAVADAGMWLNDGIAAGWAVPAGAIGSSPYFFNTNQVNITASCAGNILTVTAASGGNIESGMYLWDSGITTFKNARVYKQLTGSTGGTGTYQLDVSPTGGDFASTAVALYSENYVTSYPVHPNPAGHVWAGGKIAAGALALVNSLVAVDTTLDSRSTTWDSTLTMDRNN